MKDNNKFIEILKDEFKDALINIKINVANKQKNLSAMTDKIVGIMRQAFSTYDSNTKTFAIFDDPRMAKMLNQILEYSDMSPLNFDSYLPQKSQVVQQPVSQPANKPTMAEMSIV